MSRLPTRPFARPLGSARPSSCPWSRPVIESLRVRTVVPLRGTTKRVDGATAERAARSVRVTGGQPTSCHWGDHNDSWGARPVGTAPAYSPTSSDLSIRVGTVKEHGGRP